MKKGFTLIELLVVVSIIAIFVIIIGLALSKKTQKANPGFDKGRPTVSPSPERP